MNYLLIVAIFFNSMLVSQFMDIDERIMPRKKLIRITLSLVVFGLLILIFGGSLRGLGTLLIFIAFLFWLYRLLIKNLANSFRTRFLVVLEKNYEKLLRYAMSGKRAYIFVIGTFFLLIFSFVLVGISKPKVEFFPDNDPW